MDEARERFQHSGDCWDGDELEIQGRALPDLPGSLLLGPDGKPYPAPAWDERNAFVFSIDYPVAFTTINRKDLPKPTWLDRIRWKWYWLQERWADLWHDEPEGGIFWSQGVEDDVLAQLEGPPARPVLQAWDWQPPGERGDESPRGPHFEISELFPEDESPQQ